MVKDVKAPDIKGSNAAAIHAAASGSGFLQKLVGGVAQDRHFLRVMVAAFSNGIRYRVEGSGGFKGYCLY